MRSSGSSDGSTEAEVSLLLDHLDVTLLKGPGATGWDSFSLDYVVRSPVSAVLDAAALAQYRQAYTFLWKLKRVEHALSGVWRKHCTTARLLQHHLDRDPVMHGCHLLRNEMIHFVSNLQYYLMFEVIECSWDQLTSQLAVVTDLDGLLSAHRSYLASIMNKALLSDEVENASLHETLTSLFEVIVKVASAPL